MMKRFLAILLAALMVLSMAACKKKPDAPATGEAKTGEAKTEEKTPSIASYDFTQYGKGYVSIVGAEHVKDEDDTDLLRVYYDFTNKDKKGQTPDSGLKFNKVMQGETELDDTYIDEDDPAAVAEDNLDELTIQPGITARLTKLFEFDPEGEKVTFRLYLMVGSWVFSEETTNFFTFELDPKNLPGKPEKEMEYPRITDPQYVKNAPASGSYPDLATPYEVELTGEFEVLAYDEDDENGKAIRVGLVYKNLDDQAWPVGVSLDITAYQDGLSLPFGSTWYIEEPTAEDEAYGEDVEPGETVKCNALFVLRNDSPVEIVIEEIASDLVIGKIFPVK